MSLIVGVVSKGIKHRIKDVVKVRNKDIVPITAKPTEPASTASEKVKGAYSYKLDKYLKEADQWEENNSKLYVRCKYAALFTFAGYQAGEHGWV